MNYGKKSLMIKIENLKSKKTKRLNHMALRAGQILLLSLCTIAAVLLGCGAGIIKGMIDNAPAIEDCSFRPEGFATVIYDRDGNEAERLIMAGSNREEASFEEIPQDLVNAFIAIEDNRFWENSGIDTRGILRAVKGVVTDNSSAGGGSTITQQLIKNTVFNGGREKLFAERLERKVQEWYLAVRLTQVMDKKSIMTNYLNTINLGANTLGVKVAARRYFDKELKDLTLSECTVLAGITKNPTRLNPIKEAAANSKRRRTILDNMLSMEMISKEQWEEALKDDVYARIQSADQTARDSGQSYSYFTDAVIAQAQKVLTEELGYTDSQAQKLLYGGGLSIYTTQDMRLQSIVDEEINNEENYTDFLWSMEYRLSVLHENGETEHFSEYDVEALIKKESGKSYMGLYKNKEDITRDTEQFKQNIIKDGDQITGERLDFTQQPQVSFVLMEQATGKVAAISGGRGEKKGNLTLNRATAALRQPGSTFKVVTAFAPALDACGATLATSYYDGPYQWGTKSFRNWYNNFTGYGTIRDGIVYSINITAVRCMMEAVTPQLGVDYAQNMGITTLTEKDYNPATALGGVTDGVTNLELTAAYAAIANHGVYTEPVFFTKILDHDGKVLITMEPRTHRALKETTAFLLTDALTDAMEGVRRFSSIQVNPPGSRARLSSMSCAGKSGTTTTNKDIWFVGFTPYYTAGIWSGNDKAQVIKGSTSFHKNIWRNIMNRVNEGLDDPGFPVPGGLIRVPVCRKSGKRAINGVCTMDPRGNAVYEEYFVKGTEPSELCDRHTQADICTESGLTAGPDCPEHETRVFIIIDPMEGASDDTQYALPGPCALPHTSVVLPPTDGPMGPDPAQTSPPETGPGAGLGAGPGISPGVNQSGPGSNPTL